MSIEWNFDRNFLEKGKENAEALSWGDWAEINQSDAIWGINETKSELNDQHTLLNYIHLKDTLQSDSERKILNHHFKKKS